MLGLWLPHSSNIGGHQWLSVEKSGSVSFLSFGIEGKKPRRAIMKRKDNFEEGDSFNVKECMIICKKESC